MNDNEDIVVVAVRLNGAISWLRGPPELWILDYRKWREGYVSAGHSLPELDRSDRGGFHIVDTDNAHQFLQFVDEWRVSKDDLARELATRYQQAHSWWDVRDLFPIEFIDFDRRQISAFYHSGPHLEKYALDGWTAAFEDFATEWPEDRFPVADKFWVREGFDLLALLNERGAKLSQRSNPSSDD